MAAGLAEDLHEEVTGAVDDLGVHGEIRRAIDHAQQFDDAGYAVEGTKFGADGGEAGEHGGPGRGVAVFDGEILARLAGDERAIRQVGAMARNEEEVPGPGGGEVVGRRRTLRGDGYAKFVETGFSGHAGPPRVRWMMTARAVPFNPAVQPSRALDREWRLEGTTRTGGTPE